MTQRPVFPLPTTFEELDADWLTAALRVKRPAVTVSRAEVVDMIRGTCTLVRMRLATDAADVPETVILKGGFETHSRDWSRMHMKEALAYRDVLPVLGLNSPTCYFADYEPETRQGIVVMDDLAARGVTFCHAQTPQTYAQVERRLSMLAAFHARTWSPAEQLRQGPWGWLRDHAEDSESYIRSFMTPEVWTRYVTAPRGAAGSVHFQDAAWVAQAHARITRLAQTLPHSVLHADTHLGNLYVEADGTPGFFDPISVRGPAMMEVSYHLCCALDVADRPNWERPLIRHYLDEVRRAGAEPPSFDEAMWQYAVFLARGYGVFLVNDSIFQAEAVNTAYLARFSAAMIDHDTLGHIAALPH
jgi:hypothetical protein